MEKKGQVWVETVIYTLIGFMLIALVFTFAKPKIQEMQDKIVINDDITFLERIDVRISSVLQGGANNRRIESVKVSAGEFVIDSDSDKIYFELESDSPYSEEGVVIEQGVVFIETIKSGGSYLIEVTLDYSGELNLTFQGKEGVKNFAKSSAPYEIAITHQGYENDLAQINLEVNL